MPKAKKSPPERALVLWLENYFVLIVFTIRPMIAMFSAITMPTIIFNADSSPLMGPSSDSILLKRLRPIRSGAHLVGA